MDPILETILEILGHEVARRVLGSASPPMAGPQDPAVRQGAAPVGSDITLHIDQLQGPPCDVVDALYEQRLFDVLMED